MFQRVGISRVLVPHQFNFVCRLMGQTLFFSSAYAKATADKSRKSRSDPFTTRHNPFSQVLAVICITIFVFTVSPAFSKEAKDKTVEPTHAGGVNGRIYDAEAGQPISGAQVVVEQNGVFASEGKTVGSTDSSGLYKCGAELGRVSSNIDVGRLLNVSLIGLLSGGANNVTKRIDITYLNMRVSASGYKTFEGMIPCRSVDTNGFRVYMEPVLLVREGGSQVSTVAPGWGIVQIKDVTVEPEIQHPGEEVKISAYVKCPSLANTEKMTVKCYSRVFGAKELALAGKPDKSTLVYSKKFSMPKKDESKTEAVVLQLEQCPYDVVREKNVRKALIQVVRTPAEKNAAELRLQAFKLYEAGSNAESAAKLKELTALPDARIEDYSDLGTIAMKIHEYQTAALAYKHVVDMTPEKSRIAEMDNYAEALLAGGKFAQVISEIEPAINKFDDKQRKKKVPASLPARVGSAYVGLGKLESAEAVNAQLDGYKDGLSSAAVTEFRSSLRMAHVQAEVNKDPKNAQAWAEYGRLLIDQGRWEEAVGKLRKSISLDSGIPAVKGDLGYALVHIRGDNQASKQSFDDALAAAEAKIQSSTGKEKTKDFNSWHTLGILLYRKACRQQDSSDAGYIDTLQRAQDTLKEALRCGRAGSDVKSDGNYLGAFGYFGSRVVGVSGFAYPEANSDFVLLEGIKVVSANADNYLAHFNIAAALVDLGQGDLAARSLTKCMALKPDYTEAHFVMGLVYLQQGNDERAKMELLKVKKANPRHPKADLMLAKLYTEDGDMAAASACLANHARYYGSME